MRTLFINPVDQRPRAFWRLLIHGVAWVVTLLFVLLPFVILDSAMKGSQILAGHSLLGHLTLTLGILAAVLITLLWISFRVDRRPIEDYGLRIDRIWWRDYGAGFLFGALQMLAIFGVLFAGHWIRVSAIHFTSAVALSLAANLVLHLVVGFEEELLSRGGLLITLEELLRVKRVPQIVATIAAMLLTSTLFGLMHKDNPNATTVSTCFLIFAGVALAIPVLLTRQLGFSMGAHASWNFFQGAILGFPVSGTTFAKPIIDSNPIGPQLLTGGAFGPEAGVVALLVNALSLVAVYAYVKKTRGRAAILPPPQLPHIEKAGEGIVPPPALQEIEAV
ncbi:MAG: CPBP family intramembrane metalloprotease [Acidobacteriota bacterium]|nr:CPBP family intramembrane metalloprotease [Acidobacteriota bacterium]